MLQKAVIYHRKMIPEAVVPECLGFRLSDDICVICLTFCFGVSALESPDIQPMKGINHENTGTFAAEADGCTAGKAFEQEAVEQHEQEAAAHHPPIPCKQAHGHHEIRTKDQPAAGKALQQRAVGQHE